MTTEILKMICLFDHVIKERLCLSYAGKISQKYCFVGHKTDTYLQCDEIYSVKHSEHTALSVEETC